MLFNGKSISEHVEILSSINDEVENCMKYYLERGGKQAIINVFRENMKILNYLQSITVVDDTNIFQILLHLSKEYVAIEESDDAFNLKAKYLGLKKSFDYTLPLSKSLYAQLDIHTKDCLKSISCRSIYSPDIIITVAVPNEFRAIYSQLHYVYEANSELLLKVLEPDYNEAKRPNALFVNGILKTKNRSLSISIILQKEYGSVSNDLSDFIKKYPLFEEVISVGVAGHMDSSGNAMIGDVIISTGYYNAYHQKYQEKIFFADKNIYPIESVPDSFIEDWNPKNLIFKRPAIVDESRERATINITKGTFVSGPAVVKNRDYKQNILDSFKDSTAVEMEAHGIYTTLNGQRSKFKMVKSICDWSDESKTKEWQPHCAEIAAKFTIDYLINKNEN